MSGLATSAKPWPFAPLNPSHANLNSQPKLAGIVFDVDGTLSSGKRPILRICKGLPQNYMFKEMRAALGITKATDILGHLNSLSDKSESEANSAWNVVKSIERRAMARQTPQPGLAELMNYLDSRQVRRAIVTRNFDEPVRHLLLTFLDSTSGEKAPPTSDRKTIASVQDGLRGFSPILTRAFSPSKPAPDPLLHIAQRWDLPSDERCEKMIMVGDSQDDVDSGRAAGAFTVVLGNKENEAVFGDWRITSLEDLVELLDGRIGYEGTASPI